MKNNGKELFNFKKFGNAIEAKKKKRKKEEEYQNQSDYFLIVLSLMDFNYE